MIQTLAVIGAGTMGRGIAETAAARGIDVILVEVNAGQRDSARLQIAKSVEKAIQRGKLAEKDPSAVLSRIRWESTLLAAAKAEFVIEAVSENEPLKIEVLTELDRLCPAGIVLASNTSSISITRLAAATHRSAEVVGMHNHDLGTFGNPLPGGVALRRLCCLQRDSRPARKEPR